VLPFKEPADVIMHGYYTADKKVLEGEWNEAIKWEFYLSSKLPDVKLCSAVFGLPIIGENLLLTKTHRGWELPGGHIEIGEKVIDALKREIFEEVGLVVDRCVFYGYRKIISSKVIYNRNNEPYPYPISYIPHFLVNSDSEPKKPIGEEVIDSGVFAFDSPEVKNSHVKDIINISIGELGRIS
jgi:8-oxo-dGTP pyrophosphatase MutT (NUDIX family)